VGEPLILETTFLIDLEREHHRGRPGRAIAFLEAHDNARVYVTFTIAGELAAGSSLSDRRIWETFLAPFYTLPSSLEVSWQYGRAFQHLQKNGQLIGTNDLWIAATALAYRMPIVTANHEEYQRVPGLEVLHY
jgi:predicted nucleic acid-binding protein